MRLIFNELDRLPHVKMLRLFVQRCSECYMQYESTQYLPEIIFLGLSDDNFWPILRFWEDFSYFKISWVLNRSFFSGSFWKAKYINDCANEDSAQKEYPPSLARFFTMHLMSSFLHMGNKDSDQARQWLRLSLVFAGRIGHYLVWGNTSGKCVVCHTPSITFHSQFLCWVCNDIIIYSFTQMAGHNEHIWTGSFWTTSEKINEQKISLYLHVRKRARAYNLVLQEQGR